MSYYINPQWNRPQYPCWHNPLAMQYGPYGNYWGFPQISSFYPTYYSPQMYQQQNPSQGPSYQTQGDFGTDLMGILGFGALRYFCLKSLLGR